MEGPLTGFDPYYITRQENARWLILKIKNACQGAQNLELQKVNKKKVPQFLFAQVDS
jgi:predicted RNA-binding protein with PUA-like domain